MWLYSGAEHYTYNKRFIEGYNDLNKDKEETGFDINQWVWKRKLKYIRIKEVEIFYNTTCSVFFWKQTLYLVYLKPDYIILRCRKLN